MHLLFLYEFKLDHNTFQTAANINRTWGEGSTCNWIVWHSFQRFLCVDMNLEDQKCKNFCLVKQNVSSTGWSMRSNFISCQHLVTSRLGDTAEAMWDFATSTINSWYLIHWIPFFFKHLDSFLYQNSFHFKW